MSTTGLSDRDAAALMAGMHELFGLLVRRLAIEGSADIAELLIDLDRLQQAPGRHPLTSAVLEDAHEHLLGVLARGEHGAPRSFPQDDLPSAAPLRRSPLYPDRHRE